MPRFIRLIIPVISVPLLFSCQETEQQKLHKLAEIQKQNQEMQASIENMDKEAAKVLVVNDMDVKLRHCEANILIQAQKDRELDAMIDALSLRRDAMRIKLGDFRRSHPAD